MKKFLTFVMALAFLVPLLNLNICLASNMPHVHFDEKWIHPGKWQVVEYEYEYEEEEEEEAPDIEVEEEEKASALKKEEEEDTAENQKN